MKMEAKLLSFLNYLPLTLTFVVTTEHLAIGTTHACYRYCESWTNCTFGLYPSSGVSKNWGI